MSRLWAEYLLAWSISFPDPTCSSRPQKVEHLVLRGFSKAQNNFLTQIPLPVCTWVDSEGSPAPWHWHTSQELPRASLPALYACPSLPCPPPAPTWIAELAQTALYSMSSKWPWSQSCGHPAMQSLQPAWLPLQDHFLFTACPDGKQAQPHFLCLTARATCRMPERGRLGLATALI